MDPSAAEGVEAAPAAAEAAVAPETVESKPEEEIAETGETTETEETTGTKATTTVTKADDPAAAENKDVASESKNVVEHKKCFVGGLNHATDEAGVKAYFSKFGTVVDTVVMRDSMTRQSRGFGFVTFMNGAAYDACMAGGPHMIDGHKVEPKAAVKRPDHNTLRHSIPKRLFAGGLPQGITEEEFKKYFEQFGEVESTEIIFDRETRRMRGFGFVTFKTEEGAASCVKRTNHEIQGKFVELKGAETREQRVNNMERGHPNMRGGYGGGFGRPPMGRGPAPGYNGGPRGGYDGGYNAHGGEQGGYNGNQGYNNNQGAYNQGGYGGYQDRNDRGPFGGGRGYQRDSQNESRGGGGYNGYGGPGGYNDQYGGYGGQQQQGQAYGQGAYDQGQNSGYGGYEPPKAQERSYAGYGGHADSNAGYGQQHQGYGSYDQGAYNRGGSAPASRGPNRATPQRSYNPY